jgi:flagellar biosynthesis protein FliP
MFATSGPTFLSAYVMPWLSPALRERRESPTLVVVTTALQLGLVVLVWLLALVPAALVALTVLVVKLIRRALGIAADPTPYDDGH